MKTKSKIKTPKGELLWEKRFRKSAAESRSISHLCECAEIHQTILKISTIKSKSKTKMAERGHCCRQAFSKMNYCRKSPGAGVTLFQSHMWSFVKFRQTILYIWLKKSKYKIKIATRRCCCCPTSLEVSWRRTFILSITYLKFGWIPSNRFKYMPNKFKIWN